MASSMAVPRSSRSAGSGVSGSGVGRNIPVVAHPMAKLGNTADLSIRGTSSLGMRQRSNLSADVVRKDVSVNLTRVSTSSSARAARENDGADFGRKSCPDRIIQWPPVCNYEPPYSYRKSAMPRGFLPKIDEKEEIDTRQRKTNRLDIEVVEKTIDGKRREILKLPSIEKVVEKIEDQREHLVGPKATAVKQEDIQFSGCREKVQELTDVVREKLTTGYYGLRHLFRANDPNGCGNVSREALLRILYSLCGFITRDQYSNFLKSLGLEGKETIAFDQFVGCFKENETVQKQWVSPVQRSALEDALKRRHPEEKLKLNLMKYDPYTSAPFSDTIFKSKMKTLDDARKVFPAVCFEPDGMIVPPQLREAYAQIGIYLHDADFQVLWERYDTEGCGGIRTIPFLRKLGCDVQPRPKTFHRSQTHIPVQQPQRPKSDNVMYKSQDITEKVQHDVETTAVEEKKTEVNGNTKIHSKKKNETTVEKENKTVTENETTNTKPIKPALKKGKPKLDNIIDCLHYRFEEAYNAMLTAFELFDYMSDGYISRVDFRRVLQEFGFNISITDLDHFLSSVEKLSKKLGDKTVTKTFKSIFGNRLNANKFATQTKDRVAETSVSDEENIVTFGKSIGAGTRTVKTAWAERSDNQSSITTDKSTMNRQSTSHSESKVSDRRRTAQFGNSSFSKMAKTLREKRESQKSVSAVVGNRCFSRVSEKVVEKTIDHDKRCVSVGNTSISVETKTTQKSVSTVDIRASIRSIRGQLNYKDFLYKYQSKSDNSITNRIVTNQSHVFQHDSQPLPSSNLSVDEMEAKLVDYFHGDFLKLISFLKSCDKYGLGVITPHEFKSALEKRLGYTMSEKQWEQLKTDVGQDKDGLIPYNKFLQLFDVMPGSWNKQNEGGVDVVKVVKADMPAPPPEVMQLKERAKTTLTPGTVEKNKLDGSGNRTIVEMKRLLEELFKNKFHTFDKHFKQMDRKMMGRMSKWQFGALIKLCGLAMNQQELDKVWATLSVANDGMYSYSALIRHFIQFKPKNQSEGTATVMEDTTEAVEMAKKVQRERREAKVQDSRAIQETEQKDKQEKKEEPVQTKTPPPSAASVKSQRTKDLLIKIKPDVISNWEGLKSVLKYIDKDGCATINYNEITEVMKSMKFNLTAEEQKELIQRFDLQKNGRFHYLEFMKCFAHRPAPTPRYKTLVYSKHAHKLEQRQRDIGSATVAQVINNLRKKLMSEHRNLRRAFKKLDRQNQGHLSVLDFKKALTSCKVNFSNEDFYHLLSEFDRDMTGKISYQNFLTTFMNASN